MNLTRVTGWLTDLIVSIFRASEDIYPGYAPQALKNKFGLMIAAVRHQSALKQFFLRMSVAPLQQVKLNTSDVIGMTVWPYINNAWTVQERLDKKAGHYELLVAHYPMLFSMMRNESLVLMNLDAYSPGLRLVLEQPVWFKREGEYVLSLFVRGTRVSSVAFTLGCEGQRTVCYIGAFQGITQSVPLADRQLIFQTLSHDFDGMRVTSLLLTMLQMFTHALGLSCLLGIDDAHRHHRHPFFGPFDPQQLVTDYDRLWSENAGVLDDISGFYRISTVFHRRLPPEIAPRKRALYDRRYRRLDQLGRELSLRLGAPDHAS